jgi:ABC-type Fe3+ transport system substrate-binding protein
MRRSGEILGIALIFAAGVGTARADDQAMIAAAKKEGSVTWYTSQIIDQFARPVASAFKAKYGIRIDYIRANASDVALRIYNEAKAGQNLNDVFDGSTTVTALEKSNLAMKWTPEAAARLPRQFVDPNGYWTAENIYAMAPGFNTNLVPRGQEPRSYDDLLDPKWKGKMAWGSTPSSSAAPGFIGIVLAAMGEEKGMAYLQKLAKQNIADLSISSRAIYDRVISGEYPLALQLMNHQAYISAKQGAPVDWIPMNPALSDLNVVGVSKNAPHPNAAKLFVNFLISDDGQKIFRDAGYIPVAPDVPPLDPKLRPNGTTFKAIYFTPEQVEDSMPRWMKIFSQYFR